ncbi:oxidoreductase [Pseudomonas sp. AL-54]|nr:oxidoreductase [Pseudomonas lopnurensis]
MRVVRHEPAAQGVTLIELEPDDGQPLRPFRAGAHLALELNAGVRQYSLCNGPAETVRYRLAVRLEADGRGGSREVCEDLQAGSTLNASGPFNHFPLEEDDPCPLLIAGGIGITPLLAMAREREAQGRAFELHYSGRSQAGMAFHEELSGRGDGQVFCYADGVRMDLEQVIPSPSARHLYVCGPARLIDAVLAVARGKGWSDAQVHFERFGAEAPAALDGDGAFEVQIKSSGEVIAVGAEESVADALQRHGLYINLSCGSGVCGSCRLGVLDGDVDHRDYFFSPQEQAANDQFTPCCSRARSARLVLDL